MYRTNGEIVNIYDKNLLKSDNGPTFFSLTVPACIGAADTGTGTGNDLGTEGVDGAVGDVY